MLSNISLHLVPQPIYFIGLIVVITVYAFRYPASVLGRFRYVLVVLTIWSYAASAPVTGNTLIASLERQYPLPVQPPVRDGPPLVVVLSSGYAQANGHEYRIRLGEDSWERIHAGVRLWRNLGGKLMFVGGPTPDGKTSVAEAMARVAGEMGVPRAAILVESRSRNTRENILFTQDTMAQYGRNVWLVTSALHMPRAMAVARQLGVALHPYPCDFRHVSNPRWREWFPTNNAIGPISSALHEYIGLAFYLARGWAELPVSADSAG
jgi:uncharacterized SAM-binding protein YcdF (DUF218 family)